MIEDLKTVTSITGINKGTATTFLAEMGSIDKYASHKKLIAFAGIDPAVYQSGKYEGTGGISKRGNRYIRRIIWLMTRNVIQHNSLFRTFFLKKRGEGQAHKKAMFATSHKLIRVVFALALKKKLLPPGCA